ncbi:single-stranded DNA-binding protein [Cryptosporangium sp. NPDC051539]|uniref:single-stranded DNA-binding protein n=1 Tax=Cryptosporangium sp. NPDC051539 TaxID=3363962 RepID=UPI00379FD11B
MNETTTTIVGNVVDSPSKRVLDSGISVTSFRVASTSRRYDRVTNGWADGESLYLKVTCWRNLAENTAASIVKGDPVIVHGRLFTRLYEVAESRRAAYELEATAVGFDLNRGSARFKRSVSSRASTVDEVGPDGLPTGGAVDAHLETGIATEAPVEDSEHDDAVDDAVREHGDTTVDESEPVTETTQDAGAGTAEAAAPPANEAAPANGVTRKTAAPPASGATPETEAPQATGATSATGATPESGTTPESGATSASGFRMPGRRRGPTPALA